MSESSPLDAPEVTDADVRWASRLLNLPPHAFCGKEGNDPRQTVLKSMEPMDVAACPGSGKTTLLVAKLAILAEKWHYGTQGICVLSHTNAARKEIETKLGNSVTGRRLLSYPHYVGTIHRFVDEFLAMPWLRSRGYQIKIIDTDLCLHSRWNALTSTIQSGLERNRHGPSILSVKSPDFGVGDVRWGKGGVLGTNTDTYKRIRNTCQQSATRGYFCYDEMFMWAGDLMDKAPGVVGVIRSRFPVLFIDEAQDNSEDQSGILHRIFMGRDGAVIRQRFGDANQAIFNFVGDKGPKDDKFPDEKIKKDLPNSHRFGQTIADLADPFGLVPCGLKGQGPAKKLLASGAQEGRHTIFLFDAANATKVLDAYGELLLETFSDQELRDGSFLAVGLVHRPPENEGEDHKFPHHIGHYWPDYNPELSKQDPKPGSFVEYVLAGMAKAKMTGETCPAVEKIAEGILRLAGMAQGGITLHQRRHSHRYVVQLLENNAKARKRYDAVLERFILRREAPTKEMWNDDRRRIVKEIGETVAKSPLAGAEVEDFLAWPDEPEAPALSAVRKVRDNIYRFPKDGREAAIQVGSIHSVKGKTNTSTLVLETYWHYHNLESIKDWLSNDLRGGEGQNDTLQSRLKLQYVAMTRPTHLLCLAMKRSTFEKEDGNLDQGVMQKLARRGWQIKCV